MNPFVYLMALRNMWRVAKAYDETSAKEKAEFHKACSKPFDMFMDGYNGVGPKQQRAIRKPFRIMLLILAIIVFISMVIGGH